MSEIESFHVKIKIVLNIWNPVKNRKSKSESTIKLFLQWDQINIGILFLILNHRWIQNLSNIFSN